MEINRFECMGTKLSRIIDVQRSPRVTPIRVALRQITVLEARLSLLWQTLHSYARL